MKPTLLILLSLCFTLNAFGQDDAEFTGFTNRIEAVNYMGFNGKEGKWLEYLDKAENILKDTNAALYYRLVDYTLGKINGPVRYYYKSGKPFKIVQYAGNEINGTVNTYYENKGLLSTVYYINDEKCGDEIVYEENGKVRSKTYFKCDYNIADTGFSNKAEAKNLIVNGKKEGKWKETWYKPACFTNDSTFECYQLAIYKQGKIVGTFRRYDRKWNLILLGVPSNYLLNGTVTDTNTHKPIQDALIRLFSSSNTKDSTTTNSDGTYKFDSEKITPNTSYVILVDAAKQGYNGTTLKKMITTVGVYHNHTFTANWELKK